MPAGRKPKWDKETVTKLEQAFSLGADVTEACLHAGISRNTYYRNIATHKQLSDRFKQLQHRPALRARATLFEALKSDPWLAWKYLQRVCPDEFYSRAVPKINPITVEVVRYSDA